MAWAPSMADKNWGQVCRRAGLDTITLHDVRHTWPRLDAQTQTDLGRLMAEVTAARTKISAPPVPVNSVRVVPLPATRRTIVRRVESPSSQKKPTVEWSG